MGGFNTAQASGSQSYPKPPKFRPLDIGALGDEAFRFNSDELHMSTNDLAQRFPGIVSTDAQRMKDDAAAIQGKTTPEEQNAMVEHGLERSLGAFGGAQGEIGSEGSASRNVVASTVARDAIAKEDQDRGNLEGDLAAHPERQMGLGGAEVAKLMIGNIIGQNVSNRNAYLAAMGQLQQQNSQAAQNERGLISVGGSLVGAGAKAYSGYNNSAIGDYGAANNQSFSTGGSGYLGGGSGWYYDSSGNPVFYNVGGG